MCCKSTLLFSGQNCLLLLIGEKRKLTTLLLYSYLQRHKYCIYSIMLTESWSLWAAPKPLLCFLIHYSLHTKHSIVYSIVSYTLRFITLIITAKWSIGWLQFSHLSEALLEFFLLKRGHMLGTLCFLFHCGIFLGQVHFLLRIWTLCSLHMGRDFGHSQYDQNQLLLVKICWIYAYVQVTNPSSNCCN